ncbi:MAG: hypothetical protein KAV99_00500 [Candidatus Latescibacteria bacterium]|nr:hypothetical protein [Candidatus Latescibacterota bacterium]
MVGPLNYRNLKVQSVNLKAGLVIVGRLAVGLLILLAASTSVSGENRRVKAKVGVEYDGNVFEETDDRTGGLRARFYLDSSSTLFRSERVLASLRYQAGFKRYLGSVPQDSLSAVEPIVNSLSLDLGHKLTERIVVAIGSELKSRILIDGGQRHLPNQDGYLQGAAGLSLKIGLSRDLVGTLSCQGSFVNFKDFQEFDLRAREIQIALDKRFSGRLRCGLEASWKRLNFNRDSLNKEWQPREEPQRDSLLQTGFNFKFYRLFLMNGSYSFLTSSSNSCGYSFSAHRFTLLLGKMLTNQISLQLYGIFQLKRYTDNIPEIPLVFVPHKELEGTVLVAKLSGDITDRYAIDVKYALHRDESVQRDRFHTKSLYSSSLSLTF